MQTNEILIHYGELSTKGKNRKMFQQKMAEQIRLKTKHLEKVRIISNHDFMFVQWKEASYEEISNIIAKIPGISRFEPVYRVEKNLEAIKKLAVEIFNEIKIEEGESFRVVAKRSDKEFEHDTMAIQREVGSAVGYAYPQLSVDLRKPTYSLRVNIHLEDTAYLSLLSTPGLGGLPYGSSGKGLLMLSGGFDSPVAGYQMIKRGLAIEAVHFSSPPYTSPQALEKAKKLTAVLSQYGLSLIFHNVPFTKIQEEIKAKIHDDFSMTVMRRMMLRIMDRLLETRDANAIVTGESLGQVASQTIKSIEVINEVTNSPVFRPLIAVDKNDIIAIAEQIGSYDISNEPYDDCCTVFAPRTPKTKPRLDIIEGEETKIDVEGLVEDALNGIEVMTIDEHYIRQTTEAFSHLL